MRSRYTKPTRSWRYWLWLVHYSVMIIAVLLFLPAVVTVVFLKLGGGAFMPWWWLWLPVQAIYVIWFINYMGYKRGNK